MLFLRKVGDDRIQDVAELTVDVPGKRAQAHPDLIRSKTGAPLLVDVLQEILDKGANARGDVLDRIALGAQNRVANNANVALGHYFSSSCDAAAPAECASVIVWRTSAPGTTVR